MPELKRRRRAASEPDADSADATQEYSPYVPTFQSACPEDPNAQPTFTNENAWQPDYADDDADIPAPVDGQVGPGDLQVHREQGGHGDDARQQVPHLQLHVDQTGEKSRRIVEKS